MLVRSNGRVQDLRAAARGRAADPDPDHARQGRSRRARRAPPLVRAPARRGRPAAVPGREGRDRPADRERLLLRLRVPRADPRGGPRADRGGDPARARGRARRGSARRSRARRRARASRPRASRTRSSSSTPPRAPISLYTQGDFTDLCRGPHLQDSRPIKAIKLTGLAGAYWRGDEKQHAADADLRHGVLLAGRPRRVPRAARGGARRDHRRLGPQLDLFHFAEHSPGSPFWHPKGMVIWNELEELRRRENAQARLPRGEDAADLRHRDSG